MSILIRLKEAGQEESSRAMTIYGLIITWTQSSGRTFRVISPDFTIKNEGISAIVRKERAVRYLKFIGQLSKQWHYYRNYDLFEKTLLAGNWILNILKTMTYGFISPRRTIGTLFALFCGISHAKTWFYIILLNLSSL